jgi:hypothetical protein
VTSVLAAVALASVTITAAAVTLTNAPERKEPTAAAPPSTTSSSAPTDDPTLAPPAEIEDVPVGIPDIALVAADGPRLDDVPDQALAAYQRSAAVLAEADAKCNLEWTLLAAVGQVVTAHGTTGGGALADNGVMRPRFTGKPLLGKKGDKLPDSDAGKVDGDTRYDRPVGPLQLAPSTWAVVGVDGDGNGKRNPYDVDDAALAVAVLLCSGDDDLRKRPGRIAAVKRINDDKTFIETVLAVDRTYRDQASEVGDDAIVVARVPATEMPTDLPTGLGDDDVTETNADPSDDQSTEEPEPTDAVTWSNPLPTGNPTDPTSPTGPTDPTDPTSSGSCSTDTPSDASTDATCSPSPSGSDTSSPESTD